MLEGRIRPCAMHCMRVSARGFTLLPQASHFCCALTFCHALCATLTISFLYTRVGNASAHDLNASLKDEGGRVVSVHVM